jgi:translation initiation factor IF-3
LKADTTRINHQIRAKELRIIGTQGENHGVLSLKEALELAQEAGLDLIEISPTAVPPIAKIMDYGKFQYDQKKKQKSSKVHAKIGEVKSIQVKMGTGEHDLALKAKKASAWLKDGHRVKAELFLRGRERYMDEKLLRGRLERIINLITGEFKIAQPIKKIPKGLMMIIERA